MLFAVIIRCANKWPCNYFNGRVRISRFGESVMKTKIGYWWQVMNSLSIITCFWSFQWLIEITGHSKIIYFLLLSMVSSRLLFPSVDDLILWQYIDEWEFSCSARLRSNCPCLGVSTLRRTGRDVVGKRNKAKATIVEWQKTTNQFYGRVDEGKPAWEFFEEDKQHNVETDK